MFNIPHQHLGDTWYCTTNERAHLFFLTCPVTQNRHERWSIAHASSVDLRDWKYHGILFDSDPQNPQRSCLSTGSVARYGDRFVMSFLGNHNSTNPGIVLAESKDLYVWHELPATYCTLAQSGYSQRGSKTFKNPRWRDPFLFELDGWLYQLMTAADEKLPLECDGVVAVMRTRDLVQWEFLPPLRTPRMGTDLECPKLYRIEGRWHLIVSLFNVLQAPHFAALQPADLNTSTSFALVSDSLDCPFSFHGNGRILENDTPGFPYACEAVQWRDDWFLLGTCWSDRLGDSICDPTPLRITPHGFRNQ